MSREEEQVQLYYYGLRGDREESSAPDEEYSTLQSSHGLSVSVHEMSPLLSPSTRLSLPAVVRHDYHVESIMSTESLPSTTATIYWLARQYRAAERSVEVCRRLNPILRTIVT